MRHHVCTRHVYHTDCIINLSLTPAHTFVVVVDLALSIHPRASPTETPESTTTHTNTSPLSFAETLPATTSLPSLPRIATDYSRHPRPPPPPSSETTGTTRTSQIYIGIRH